MMSFAPGDRVECRYDGRSKFYPASVVSVNDDGSLEVEYDGGMWNGWESMTESSVNPTFARKAVDLAAMMMADLAATTSPTSNDSAKTAGGSDSSSVERTSRAKQRASSTGSNSSLNVSTQPPALSRESSTYSIGQRIEGRYKNGSKWYSGTVMQVNDDSTYRVCFDGGMWNAWNPLDDPEVPMANLRGLGGGGSDPSASKSVVDTSPIRRKGDESKKPSVTSVFPQRKNTTAAPTPSGPPSRNNKESGGGNGSTPRVRSSSANAKKKRSVSSSALNTGNKPKTPNSSNKPTTPGTANRSKSSNDTKSSSKAKQPAIPTFRETKAMRAQREAAMKRRETLEHNDSFSPPQKSDSPPKKHSFLKRGSRTISDSNLDLRPPKSRTPASSASKPKPATASKAPKKSPDNSKPSSAKRGQSQERRKTHEDQADIPVQVVVRKRPPSDGENDCVRCESTSVKCLENKQKVDLTKYVHVHSFSYDDAFDAVESTAELYDRSIHGLVENFFGGGVSTCFCFGQTASGKTFTLFGADGGQKHSEATTVEDIPIEEGGLYLLAADEIFSRILTDPNVMDTSFITISMFEIYGQKVRDLLDDNKELQALEDGRGVLQLVGLTAVMCSDIEDFLRVSNIGRGARSTTSTGANNTSSRSHAAMLIRLNDEETDQVVGKFSLIDLAGSERGADNEATDKVTQMEGRQINTSLLALKEVIRAKELGRSHAPFRQSRLTQVLEESLTGRRCMTVVVGCISPDEKDLPQTINTLRYAEGLRPKGARKAKSKAANTSPKRPSSTPPSTQRTTSSSGRGGVNKGSSRGTSTSERPTSARSNSSRSGFKSASPTRSRDSVTRKSEASSGDYEEEEEDEESQDYDNASSDDDFSNRAQLPQIEEEDRSPRSKSMPAKSRRGVTSDDEDEDPKSPLFKVVALPRSVSWRGDVTDAKDANDDGADSGNNDSLDDEADLEELLSEEQFSAAQRPGPEALEEDVSPRDRRLQGLESPRSPKSPRSPRNTSEARAQLQKQTRDVLDKLNARRQTIDMGLKIAERVRARARYSVGGQSPKASDGDELSLLTNELDRDSVTKRLSLDDRIFTDSPLAKEVTPPNRRPSIVARRVQERDAELAEKEKTIVMLQNRIGDLNRSLTEADGIRIEQVALIRKERQRVEDLEQAHHEQVLQLEKKMEDLASENLYLQNEVEKRDGEIVELLSVIDARAEEMNSKDETIAELKEMVQSLMSSQDEPVVLRRNTLSPRASPRRVGSTSSLRKATLPAPLKRSSSTPASERK